MSHDVEALWAGSALAAHLVANPGDCLPRRPSSSKLSAFSGREGKVSWPHADGVVMISDASTSPPKEYPIAVEFKRQNEGIHGVLTAIGQAHAYLHKGYAGSAIVVPHSYPTLADVGPYINQVLTTAASPPNIGVFVYLPPDTSAASPFAGKLKTARSIQLSTAYLPSASFTTASLPKTETQWAHVREGSTEPDAVFKYLQSLKLMTSGLFTETEAEAPAELLSAIRRIDPSADPSRYLANAPGAASPDKAWRNFWFRFVLTKDVLIGWSRGANGLFVAGSGKSRIERVDGRGVKSFFANRRDSIKNKLVLELNAGHKREDDAWEDLAKNFRSRAHSYREDIDSSCNHLGFVDATGLLTDDGFRFVDACERYGNPNAGVPRSLFAKSLLGEGGFSAFLHYVWRLSDREFQQDPLRFCVKRASGHLHFEHDKYLEWLQQEMANTLRVLKLGTARGGAKRKPFQAELALLRALGFVGDGFRPGVGLPINWPAIHEAIST